MKKLLVPVAVAIGVVAGPVVQAFPVVDIQGKLITSLYAHATSPCVFFQLEGVAGNPWFSIEKTNKEMYSQLLASRVSGQPIKRVYSDGADLCGSSRVMVVEL